MLCALFRLAYENIKDIIAVGFDVKKTFIFCDLDYIQVLDLMSFIDIDSNIYTAHVSYYSKDPEGYHLQPGTVIAFTTCC